MERTKMVPISTNGYQLFLKNVVGPRETSGVGNLSEALAEAYGAVMNIETFPANNPVRGFAKHNYFETFGAKHRKPWLRFVAYIISEALIDDHRPPGYREAGHYTGEIGAVIEFRKRSERIDKDGWMMKYDIAHNFKGQTWFIDELLTRKPWDFTASKSALPVAETVFLAYIDNLNHWKRGSWLEHFLEWPNEKAKF